MGMIIVRYGHAGWKAACTGLLLLAASIIPAAADDVPNPGARANVASPYQVSGALPEGVGVLDRARPGYDATGLAVGGFTLYPSTATNMAFDDNILRTPTAQESDLFWTLSPRLDLRSNWAEDALQLYGQYDDLIYDRHDSESRANWILGGTSLFNLLPGTVLDTNSSYFSTHEARTSPDISALALRPTAYAQFHADTALRNQSGPLGLTAGVSYDRLVYDPTLLVGGSLLDNADRNSRVIDGYAKASYEFGLGRSVYAQASYNVREFDLQFDNAGFDHSSEGYRLDTGLQMLISPLIKGTMFIGYLQQNFKPPFHDVSGVDFGSQIDWFTTELLTVHLTTARTLTDTTLVGASSEDERTVRLSADYELLRNVILQANAGYENDIFDGISRNDRVTTAGLDAKYFLTQRFSVYADYSHSQRDSTIPTVNFADNLISAGLRIQY